MFVAVHVHVATPPVYEYEAADELRVNDAVTSVAKKLCSGFVADAMEKDVVFEVLTVNSPVIVLLRKVVGVMDPYPPTELKPKDEPLCAAVSVPL